MKKILKYIILTTVVILVLGCPNQSRFLSKLQKDYGSAHSGMEMNSEMLQAMGSSDYRSYILFSTYNYSFGQISVRYVGVAFSTFYVGSRHKEGQPTKSDEIIS